MSNFDIHWLLQKGDDKLSVQTFTDSECPGSLGLHMSGHSDSVILNLANPAELRFIASQLAAVADALDKEEAWVREHS